MHTNFALYRNAKKSEDKVEEMERDVVETKEREEKLKEDYKKVEADAAAVMAEHEKLQVISRSMTTENIG